MKKIFILVFIIAFAACAGWGLLTNTPRQTSRSPSSLPASAASSDWTESLSPFTSIRTLFYPYFHFQEAMNQHIAQIPTYISINAIPKDMKNAVIATEDRRFYEHGAIDPVGIIRAMIVNASAGETLEGGSTISQQVVKNVFLTQERTLTRKIQEVILSFLLEHYYSKDDILEIYLNTAYFGANATGLAEACETYYGIRPERLTLCQASLLAGLVQAPTYYNPLENYEGARRRQDIVLKLMAEQGYISKKDALLAREGTLHLQH